LTGIDRKTEMLGGKAATKGRSLLAGSTPSLSYRRNKWIIIMFYNPFVPSFSNKPQLLVNIECSRTHKQLRATRVKQGLEEGPNIPEGLGLQKLLFWLVLPISQRVLFNVPTLGSTVQYITYQMACKYGKLIEIQTEQNNRSKIQQVKATAQI